MASGDTDPTRNQGLINGLPLWARIIGFLGFPIAVAALLLWVVVKQLDTHNTLLFQHDTKLDRHELTTVRHSEEMHEAMHRMTYILVVICQNAARSQVDALRCLEKP